MKVKDPFVKPNASFANIDLMATENLVLSEPTGTVSISYIKKNQESNHCSMHDFDGMFEKNHFMFKGMKRNCENKIINTFMCEVVTSVGLTTKQLWPPYFLVKAV